jgi:hypothetical protein
MCGLIACAYILPTIGANIAEYNPEHAHSYLPWLVFLWAAALPCFVILALAWKVAEAVRHEQVFTMRIARVVKAIAVLLFTVVGFFFVGNMVLLLFDMSHPGVLFISLFADVFGVLLAVVAASLSRSITKAAILQEEADGTI